MAQDDDNDMFNMDVERKVYFVRYRWWNEAREAAPAPLDVNGGVSYTTTPTIASDEIVMNLTESNEEGVTASVSDHEFALLSESMFWQAVKWHYDVQDVETVLAADNNMPNLFALQMKLSFDPDTKLLVAQIIRKDSKDGAFHGAQAIFVTESGLVRIWDFSKQITNCKDLCKGDSVQPKWEVYGSHYGQACGVGMTGLHNFGNTCYMNSAIQCLVHTPQLVDYFLGERVRSDALGNLGLAFENLLKDLWAPKAKPVVPRDFKSKVDALDSKFDVSDHQDSEEFLTFVLEKLCEELNHGKHEPCFKQEDAGDSPDGAAADRHCRNYLACKDSIINHVFYGQCRSTTVCLICKKKHAGFESFHLLHLPVVRTMTLTVLSTDGTTPPRQVTVTVPKSGRCEDLFQAVSTEIRLTDAEKLLVAEIFSKRNIHILDDPNDPLDLIRNKDQLVAYRLPKESSDKYILVVFMHQHQETAMSRDAAHRWKRFGIPLLARMSAKPQGSDLREQFQKVLGPFLMSRGDSLTEYAEEDGFQFFFLGEREFVLEGSRIQMDQQQLPISSSCSKFDVLVSWPDKLYDTTVCLRSSLPEICTQKSDSTVYDCLNAILKEEKIVWTCDHCKESQGTIKFDLLRLPDILIFQLVRFNNKLEKVETSVDFPIDLDLSDYPLQEESSKSSHSYRLYAICNHYDHDNMIKGHYTAFVQLGNNNQWVEFDDSRVSRVVDEAKIKTPAAYLLFYKRIHLRDG